MDRLKKEFLIDCVREVRPIWDKNDPHHRSKYALAEHWEIIAAKVGNPCKEVKIAWNNLSQEFRRRWHKCSRSGEAVPDEVFCKWPFYDAMSFLTSQLQPSGITESMEIHQNPESSTSYEGDEMSLPKVPPPPSALSLPMSPALSAPVPSQSSVSATRFRKRKTQQCLTGGGVISTKNDKMGRRRSKVQKQEDDNLIFLESLAPQMKKLDPQRNVLFRTEMLGRLYKLLYNSSQY